MRPTDPNWRPAGHKAPPYGPHFAWDVWAARFCAHHTPCNIYPTLSPLVVFTATGLTALFAHIYWHEHAEFLRDEPKAKAALETTHAVIWGPFHFVLQYLLRRGFRPALGAEFERSERAAILRRQRVPWDNWARTHSCRPAVVAVPQTLADLVEIAQEAAASDAKLRVVGSGFNWAAFVPTDGFLVFTERLDGVELDLSDPDRPTAWVQAGTTNRQLNKALGQHGYAVPWNVVLETVRMGGIVSVGTHGSGRNTSTMGDLVEVLEVVTADGSLRRISEAADGPEVMAAARLGLGLFGIITRARLRIVRNHNVRQVDTREPAEAVLSTLAARVQRHDSVELCWFPFNDDLWVRTLDRTEEPLAGMSHARFMALNFVQMCTLVALGGAVRRWFVRWTPQWMRFIFRLQTSPTRVIDLPTSQHYRRWIELLRCGCLEVAFKCDDDFARVRQAWEALTSLTAEWHARRQYPLNLTVNVRFIGASGALLSPAWGPGVTCYIEALCAGRPEGWEAFSGELGRRWMTIPGALPHWAKEFEQIPGVVPLARERLGERLHRFLSAHRASGVDPEGRFMNPLVHRLFIAPAENDGSTEAPPAAEDNPLGPDA